MDKQTKRFYEFGPFRLDLAQRILLRDGQHIPLTLKAYETLRVLVENSGHILEKEELLNQIWPDTFIEEATLAKNVSTLRKVLAEGDEAQEYIETIPKRGYRFVAKVKEAESEETTLILQEHTRLRIVAEEVEIAPEPSPLASAPKAPSTESQKQRSYSPRIVAVAVLLIFFTTAVFYWQMARRDSGRTTTNIKSLAVLPFRFLGAEKEEAYLGQSLTEILITRLGSIKTLIVRPTSAVLRYGGETRDGAIAGRELKVDAVLEGSVQKFGERMRVSVQLVQTRDAAVIWTGEFSERAIDLFTLEDRLAAETARILTTTLTTEEQQQLVRHYTKNIQAYQLYLKGEYLLSKHRISESPNAISYFQQAIAQDPSFALAYAKLAHCYAVLAYFKVQPPKEAFAQASHLAQKAIALDATLADAYIALAHSEFDQVSAEKYCRQAIRLAPNNIEARIGLGYRYLIQGKFDDARAELNQVLDLTPLSFRVIHLISLTYYFNRQYDQAIEECRRILELEPNFALASMTIGDSYLQLGKYNEAIAAYKQADGIIDDEENDDQIAAALALSGRRQEAIRILHYLRAEARKSYVSPFNLARICISLREKEQALLYLQKAYEDQDGETMLLKVDPRFDSLRTDPRFIDLLQRMNLMP